MKDLIQKFNGYKVYIVCGTSLAYIWLSYLLGLFAANGDLATSSFQPTTLDLHGAIMSTLGVLGAAGFRHAIQKVQDILAAPNDVIITGTAVATDPQA